MHVIYPRVFPGNVREALINAKKRDLILVSMAKPRQSNFWQMIFKEKDKV